MKVSGSRKNSTKVRNTTTQKPFDSEHKIDEEINLKISGTLREIFIETWIFYGNYTKKYTNILAIKKY